MTTAKEMVSHTTMLSPKRCLNAHHLTTLRINSEPQPQDAAGRTPELRCCYERRAYVAILQAHYYRRCAPP